MKNYIYKPQKNSRSAKFLKMLEAGARLTTRQMAQKLQCTPSHLGSIINRLRKKGILIGSVGMILNPKENIHKPGVLVNGAFSQSDYQAISNNQAVQILGRLTIDLKMAETACLVFPNMRKQIEEQLEAFQLQLLTGKQQLRKKPNGVPALPSHATNTNSN